MTPATTARPREKPLARVVSRFVPVRPVVHPDRILRIQRYSDLTRVRPVIRRAAEDMASLAQSLSAPSVAYTLVEVDALRDTHLEAGGKRFHCRAFAVQLRDCLE